MPFLPGFLTIRSLVMMWCCLGRRVSAKAHVQDLIVDITKKVAHCEIAAKDGGRLYDNDKEFETSIGGDPFSFKLGIEFGGAIEGWNKGVPGMCLGEKRRLTIPYRFAYGDGGSPPDIPPKADLVFDIQLMKINDVDLAASYLVKELPRLKPGLLDLMSLYAGHVQVAEEWKYFYILVKEKIKTPVVVSKKLMFWFNGGPGCSSMDGMFLENGPFRFDISQTPPPLVLNEKGWWKEMNVVYVDNPPGTGYSLGSYYTSSQQTADNFLIFLNEFMNIFPEYSDADIYLAGESFAGVWIPQIARTLLANKKKLKSIVMGSPWIDAANQYPANFEFSKKLNLIPPGKWMDLMVGLHAACVEELKETPKRNTYYHCERILDKVLEISEDGGEFCINKYDYRLRDKGPNEGCGMSWPWGVNDMKLYLAKEEVKRALHATQYTRSTWEECDSGVFQNVIGNTGEPSITFFPDLLQRITISIYAGDKDIICNVLGIEDSIQEHLSDDPSKNLESQLKKWGNFGTKVWFGRNLTYYRLTNASHMAPYDAPESSHEMFLDAIQYKPTTSTAGKGAIVETSPTPNSKTGPAEKLKQANTTLPNNTSSGTTVPSTSKDKPSHFAAAMFLLGFFFVAVFGGLYIKRKLTGSKADNRQNWNPVSDQTDEEIEMEEAYDYEGRHLSSSFRTRND